MICIVKPCQHQSSRRQKYYVLHGKKTVPVDLHCWGRYFGRADRTVVKTTVGDVRVSTVFLGLDHGYAAEPPQIFETMIFGGRCDDYCWRYATWDEAEAGHAAAVELVRSEMKWWRRLLAYLERLFSRENND